MTAMTLTEWAAWLAGRGVPPRLNPPATPPEIAATEQKLGLSFPADLRELYDHIQLARSLSEFWAVSVSKVESVELRIDEDGFWVTPNGYVAFSVFREAERLL